MGCVKSKKSDPTGQNANSTEKVDGKVKGSKGEKAYLVQSEVGPPDNSPQVNPVLLEYAQKLSEEIVVRAVQQWVEVDRRYSDIPYIECDVPWHGDEGVAAESRELRLPWPWHFYMWLNKDESLKHLHSESFRHLRAVSGNMNELSVIQFWPTFGLDYTWIEPKNPPPKQPKHPDPIHVSVIICIRAAASLKQKVFSWISSFSDLICPLLQFVLALCGGTCYAKQEILSDIAGNHIGPASESLPDPLMLSQGQDSFLVRGSY